MKRILTAIVGLPILLFTIWSPIPYFFAALTSLAVLLALSEFYGLASKSGCRVTPLLGHLASLALIACFVINGVELIAAVLAALAILALTVALGRRDDLRTALISASATVFGVIYVALLAACLVGVRMLADAATRLPIPNLAAKLITMFFAMVFISDTAAYYSGRSLGRHKLAPAISPGKTIEGSIGGWIGSVIAGMASKMAFFPEIPWIDAVVLGATIGVVGQVGDLAESMLKRGAEVKDSGTLLPGHGGVLDRIDSILFSAPLLYYYSHYFVARH